MWLTGGLFSSSKSQGNEICNSAMCKEVAGYILNGMNSSVDPCVDFYEFACGTWLKNNPLTDDEQAVNLFQHLTESVDNKLKNALSTKPASTDLPIIVHTKHFYASCLNESNFTSDSRSNLHFYEANFTKFTKYNISNIIAHFYKKFYHSCDFYKFYHFKHSYTISTRRCQ